MKEKFKEWVKEWDIIGILKISAFTIVLVVLLVIVLSFMLSMGNTESMSDEDDIFESERFVYKIDRVTVANDYKIIIDKITGVEYLVVENVHGVAIIKLEGGKKK